LLMTSGKLKSGAIVPSGIMVDGVSAIVNSPQKNVLFRIRILYPCENLSGCEEDTVRFTLTQQRLLSTSLILSLSCLSAANAASFQLWEQDGAQVGNYHAGYAALAQDASTSFYNPAGITRIKNQQAVFAVDSIHTNFKYMGSVTTNAL